jgi:hypothetical protein
VNDNEEISTYSSMLESTPLYLIQVCMLSVFVVCVCLFVRSVCESASLFVYVRLWCVCGVSVCAACVCGMCVRHVCALRICESASLSSNVRTHPHDHTLVHATAP